MSEYASGLLMVIIFLIILIMSTRLANGLEPKDYCIDEVFNASCPSGSVIQMTEARYGRFVNNRCINPLPGNSDIDKCGKDARVVLAQVCTGRRNCKVPVDSKSLKSLDGCVSDLVSYLEAGYQCVPAHNPRSVDCSRSGLSGDGLISLVSDEERASAPCPVNVSVPEGRTIQLNLYHSAFAEKPVKQHTCVIIGHVIDDERTNDLQLCHSQNSLNEEVKLYKSRSSRISLNLDDRFLDAAIGCADDPDIGRVFYEREGDKLTVRCGISSIGFTLTCANDTWQGTHPNCSTDAPSGIIKSPNKAGSRKDKDGNVIVNVSWYTNMHVMAGDIQIPIGLAILVSVGVAIGILVGGITLLAVHETQTSKRKAKEEKWLYGKRQDFRRPSSCIDPHHVTYDVGGRKDTSMYNMRSDVSVASSDYYDSIHFN